MAIYNNLQTVRRLNNSSLTSLIDVTNLNFKSLSDANLEFLNNISYSVFDKSERKVKGRFKIYKNILKIYAEILSIFY